MQEINFNEENGLGNLLPKLGKKYMSLNKTTMKCTYLIMLLGWGYEFFSNRALSNQVNELQKKVDNLYNQVNEMNKNKNNKALEKK